MARRAKGPTPEELIEKLQKDFEAFKEESKERTDEIERKSEEQIELVKDEYEKKLTTLKEEHEEAEKKHEHMVEELRSGQEKLWNELKEEIVTQLTSVRDDVASQGAENEAQRLAEAEKVEEKLKESGDSITALEDRMNSIVTELRSKMEEELAETNAREDLLRKESQDRICELSAKTDERFLEVSNRQEKEEAKRDEGLAELKEELDGLNGKIEEVLDSVGITIQDKLKETNSSFQLKIAQEAQEAQNQRAETDFDIASLKERMESIDQGISEVSRMYTGPEVSGSRPVLVTFEVFKDREEVLRKGNLLKGSNIHISEDISKRVRESRSELRKYMRKIKRSDPTAACFIQYDKLYVNNKIFVFNDLQGKVVEQNQVEDPLAMSIANMIMSRPGSVMDDRPGSALSNFGGLVSPTKTPVRTRRLRASMSLSDMNNQPDREDSAQGERVRELEGRLNQQQESFSEKMRNMEEVIRRQEDLIVKLQAK